MCTILADPVVPMDPTAWIKQTNQLRGKENPKRNQTKGSKLFILDLYKGTSPNLTAITSSSSQHSSVPESEREFGNFLVPLLCTKHIGDLIRLTITTPMPLIIKALKRPNGGIQLRDHKWLKMTINNSFLGEDLPYCKNLLYHHYFWCFRL